MAVVLCVSMARAAEPGSISEQRAARPPTNGASQGGRVQYIQAPLPPAQFSQPAVRPAQANQTPARPVQFNQVQVRPVQSNTGPTAAGTAAGGVGAEAAPRAEAGLEPIDPNQASAATNAPYKIPENRILEFTVPIAPASKIAIANNKNAPVDFAKAAIAVPARFDPDLPTPILLVSGSSDGDGSSIRAMQSFTNVALRMRWIVIAADGPFGKPATDNPAWRWAMVSSLLAHMHKTWPQSRRWPIVAAGVSGGGKWSGVMGAILANKGYNLIGVYMGAVNQDLASDSAKLYEPAIRFKRTPIYLSSGTDDKVATPQHHNEVKESLLHNGFSTVRLETFKGGHALSEMELRKALNWFVEEYTKMAN